MLRLHTLSVAELGIEPPDDLQQLMRLDGFPSRSLEDPNRRRDGGPESAGISWRESWIS